jgi:Zn-dependent protease with chaperone function
MADFLRGFSESLVVGPWSRIWPFFVLPLLAVGALQGLLARIESAGVDPRRQARLAAIAACVPGVITLGLTAGLGLPILRASPGVARLRREALRAGHPRDDRALSRRLAVRGAPVPSRTPASTPTRPVAADSPRSAPSSAVPVRELPVAPSVCFVSGLRRPCVVVSSGALETLSDDDLRAALLHERAHLRSRDAMRTALISAVGEFGLIPARRALEIYRTSRESLADDEAARYVGPTTIAGVLVRFARNAAPIPAAASLAEPDTLERRVRRLISPPRTARSGETRLTLAVLAAAALSLYPLAAELLEKGVFHCGR